MKDIARLATGVILLGLAIYLSLNFEEPQVAENANADSVSVDDSLSPDWQAKPDTANWLVTDDQDNSIVKPVFDSSPQVFARPLNPPRDAGTNLNQPPQIADRYQPSRSLTVTGQVSRESSLVPVQPKPAFTGSISLVRQIHTIRDGDTLQTIAREYFGSADRYLDIYLLNKDVLSNPARLPSGVEIRIPGE